MLSEFFTEIDIDHQCVILIQANYWFVVVNSSLVMGKDFGGENSINWHRFPI